jgi:transcriptional regulator with XRE-family HTH domain
MTIIRSCEQFNTANEIGGFLLSARKLQGFSRKMVAQSAGVAQSTIQRIEDGDENIGLGLLLRVAGVLNVRLGMNDYQAQMEVLKQKSFVGVDLNF